jgi:putative colanic acid biosynthesis acetyltransferase WcaF
MVHPSVKIYAPWNLCIGEYSCIGPRVELYSKSLLTIGSHTVVSQDAKIYTATHDTSYLSLPLVLKPVIIGSNCWIAAGALVGPGVRIHDYAVVGARSVVFSSVQAYEVVAGNPATRIRVRSIAS